jgi:hypothetical protein
MPPSSEVAGGAIVGAYTEELKQTVQRKVAKGMSRDQAFQFLKRKIGRAPVQYEQEIEEIIELADGNLSAHDKNRIEGLAHWAEIERARLRDLDELDKSGWSP